jgi:hypothetical protein
MTADEVWETESDNVFDVVADIDPPSARIEYAFKAGWQRGYERGHADGGRLHTPGKDPWAE